MYKEHITKIHGHYATDVNSSPEVHSNFMLWRAFKSDQLRRETVCISDKNIAVGDLFTNVSLTSNFLTMGYFHATPADDMEDVNNDSFAEESVNISLDL